MTQPLSQADALPAALLATMALMLASRSMRGTRVSTKAKVVMTLVWIVLIVLGTALATQWSSI